MLIRHALVCAASCLTFACGGAPRSHAPTATSASAVVPARSVLIATQDGEVFTLADLAWSEETAPRAISAAQAVASVVVPEVHRGEVIEALSAALRRVSGSRGVDNRRRIAFLRALGSIGDRRATPVLAEVALASRTDQSFLLNRLALEQLAPLTDPAAIEPLIELLYLFDADNPAMRANDLAANALVLIGRPVLPALLEVLAGRNTRANALSAEYVEAVRRIQPDAAVQMRVHSLVAAQAIYVLGALGAPDAFDVLLQQTHAEDAARSVGAAVALTQLALDPAQATQAREALERVYAAPAGSERHARGQLLAAMGHLYDHESLPFLFELASDRSAPDVIRAAAAHAYALLAGRVEAVSLRAMIQSEPEDTASLFVNLDTALIVAAQCDMDLSCWLSKLDAPADPQDYVSVPNKAASMVGMLGRGSAPAIAALVAHLGGSDLRTRFAVIWALDHLAVGGSPDAVARIDALRSEGEGSANWQRFASEALHIRARLVVRGR